MKKRNSDFWTFLLDFEYVLNKAVISPVSFHFCNVAPTKFKIMYAAGIGGSHDVSLGRHCCRHSFFCLLWS